MYVRQLYDDALAQASYLIGCQASGEAIVVDPLRDPAPYLALAAREGLRITHVTETHIHADFVSGARELRRATGARLFLSGEGGADWQYAYAAAEEATLLRDGDTIAVGGVRLDVLHTPGHTPEHLCFLVTDTPRGVGPLAILTGDFVFVGDVGRPDLLERAAHVANTMEAGARTLFRSLQRFKALPDHLQVWPGHGAGSACGKALGAVPGSTVGYEKRANWGLLAEGEDAFVAAVLAGQPEPPRYFAAMKRVNREGPPVLGGVPVPPVMSAQAVLALPAGCWLVDLRPTAAFAAEHVTGALCAPLSRSFSSHLGALLPIETPLVLVAPEAPDTPPEDGSTPTLPASVRQAMHDLFAIGMDRVTGWVPAHPLLRAAEEAGVVDMLPTISVGEVAALASAGATVLDVRGANEWGEGHLTMARHVPLASLPEAAAGLPDGPLLVHCQSGTRSAMATSFLHRMGRTDAVNVRGGFAAWQASGGAVVVAPAALTPL